jgi:hypothetical protein
MAPKDFVYAVEMRMVQLHVAPGGRPKVVWEFALGEPRLWLFHIVEGSLEDVRAFARVVRSVISEMGVRASVDRHGYPEWLDPGQCVRVRLFEEPKVGV